MVRKSVFEFGRDNGLVHEAVVSGRRIGADGDFWAKLAHGPTGNFAKVVELVKGKPPVEVKVNYFSALADLIVAGGFDTLPYDRCPDEKLLQSAREGSVTIDFVCLKERLCTEDVIQRIREKALRPATNRELLSLGAQRPDLHYVYSPIVAFGSQLFSRHGLPGKPPYTFVLYTQNGGRDLGEIDWGREWSEEFHFAVVTPPGAETQNT